MSDKWVTESLKFLGLTEYEAKAYTALNRIKAGTVSDIHLASGIPRSAVYGALSRLDEKGLIEVETGKPMRYRSIPPSRAIRKLKDSIDNHSEKVLRYLEEAHARGESNEASESIWTVRGIRNLYNKISDVISDAEHDIILVTTDPMFADIEKRFPVFGNILPIIQRKLEEGVRVRVICMDRSEIGEILKALPRVEVRVLDPCKPSSSIHIKGGVLMVDGEEVIMSIADTALCNDGRNITAMHTRIESILSVFRHFIEVEWDSSLPVTKPAFN